MAFYSIEDGKKLINDFNANGNAVAENWSDDLGKKIVNEMYDVFLHLNSCLNGIQNYEEGISDVTNRFLQECGGSSSSGNMPGDQLEFILNEIRLLMSVLTDSDDSSSGGSCISMSSEEEEKSSSNTRMSNMDGSMLNYNTTVSSQDDSEEYTHERAKVKRR